MASQRKKEMTVSELIERLQQVDPTRLVCVNLQEWPGPHPVSDEVNDKRQLQTLTINGERYDCFVLDFSDWP